MIICAKFLFLTLLIFGHGRINICETLVMVLLSLNLCIPMAQRLESSFAYPGQLNIRQKSEVMCLMTFLEVQATVEI